MAHPDFPTLLSPLDLGPFSVPNRVIMGSMHLGWEEHRKGMEVLAQFYRERAEGGVGLIVTGGHSPNWEGTLFPGGARMAWAYHARKHRVIPQAVHAAGGRILLQLLHGGRSSYQPWCVSASALKSPINRFKPRALGNWGVRRTIKDFATAARWAQRAGYDGVEIMGSEGYLINQFLSPAANQRTDGWGGNVENRMRMAVEIVSQTRQAVGPSFLIMFRLSLADLVPGGSTWDEVCKMARALEAAGVDVFNTGIGWHESRVPTIATLVPPGAFAFATAKLRAEVGVPVVASNRFNTPDQCEAMLVAGQADLVSMARPFLADPKWVEKAAAGKPRQINTCIGCNQSCLDHIFSGKTASCLVNPRAGWEHKFPPSAAVVVHTPRRIAVVGAGPAGMACAAEAAALGHSVELFDAAPHPGGQFLLAQQIPGKGDFAHTLRYFAHALEAGRVTCHWETRITDFTGWETRFDALVLSTGVKPRRWDVEGADHPMVVGYTALLEGRVAPGRRVAVIGAGGIGVDVADFLTHDADAEGYHAVWGVDLTLEAPGALKPPVQRQSAREVTLFQRKPGKLGAGLGKTTGWIHRATLRQRQVGFESGVTYLRVDDAGLHYSDASGKERLAAVDQIVVCAGQTPQLPPLTSLPKSLEVHTIGGALDAHRVDAARAIREGWELARSWS
jgi:2,4-dienoyl-CoA reductase (NADPH2)